MTGLPGWTCSCGLTKTPSAALCTKCIANLQAQMNGSKE